MLSDSRFNQECDHGCLDAIILKSSTAPLMPTWTLCVGSAPMMRLVELRSSEQKLQQGLRDTHSYPDAHVKSTVFCNA